MARLSHLAAALLIASLGTLTEAACPLTGACLAPKSYGGYNSTMTMEVKFAGPYNSYASQNGAQMAYGIMMAISHYPPFGPPAETYNGTIIPPTWFNYRNITVTYVIGDVIAKNDMIYSVTFTHLNASVAALANSIWSNQLPDFLPGNATDPTVLAGFNLGTGGGLAIVSAILGPGYGPWAPPPSPPPPPSPSPPPPPPSPSPSPPPPPPAPPSPPPPKPSPPPVPVNPPVCNFVLCFSGGNLGVKASPPPYPPLSAGTPAPLPSGSDPLTLTNFGTVTTVTTAQPASVSGDSSVVNYDIIFSGNHSISASQPNGLTVVSPFTIYSNITGLNVTIVGAYTVADNHYRHIFNLDGFSAVVHQTATQTEVWIGNTNGDSYNCARGFKIDGTPGWPLGLESNVTFSYLANNSIGDLMVNGYPMPPAEITLSYFPRVQNCLPVIIPFGTPMYIGASGNVGYDDNFAGTMSFIGINFSFL